MRNEQFKIFKYRLFASFEEYHQIHNHDGKEIAFVGASNSGKSSAINVEEQIQAWQLARNQAKLNCLIFLD